MNTDQLDIEYLGWKLEPTEQNLHALLNTCRVTAKQQLSLSRIEDRDDVAEGCVLKAFLWLPRLREDSTFSHWFLKVLYHAKSDYHHWLSRHKELEFTEKTIGAVDGEYNFTHDSLKLVAGKNWPLVKDLLDGFTFSEVAAKYGITVQALKSRLKRIKIKAAKNV